MARLFAIIAAVGGFFWAYELWKGQNMTTEEQFMKDVDILARTLWGEARSEGRTGMEAVASVVMNRVAYAQARGGYWWGSTVTKVCLMPWQFSCWNANDPNRSKLELVDATDASFRVAQDVARAAVSGRMGDTVDGATHYHTRAVAPAWKDDGVKVASLGAHEFYKGIG